MCSNDEGPRRNETSHFLIKSFELKCHAYIFYYFYLLLLLWSPSITDDDDFLFIVECRSYCGCGGQCVRSIVSHKIGIDGQNPELGGSQQHAGVCDCV